MAQNLQLLQEQAHGEAVGYLDRCRQSRRELFERYSPQTQITQEQQPQPGQVQEYYGAPGMHPGMVPQYGMPPQQPGFLRKWGGRAVKTAAIAGGVAAAGHGLRSALGQQGAGVLKQGEGLLGGLARLTHISNDARQTPFGKNPGAWAAGQMARPFQAAGKFAGDKWRNRGTAAEQAEQDPDQALIENLRAQGWSDDAIVRALDGPQDLDAARVYPYVLALSEGRATISDAADQYLGELREARMMMVPMPDEPQQMQQQLPQRQGMGLGTKLAIGGGLVGAGVLGTLGISHLLNKGKDGKAGDATARITALEKKLAAGNTQSAEKGPDTPEASKNYTEAFARRSAQDKAIATSLGGDKAPKEALYLARNLALGPLNQKLRADPEVGVSAWYPAKKDASTGKEGKHESLRLPWSTVSGIHQASKAGTLGAAVQAAVAAGHTPEEVAQHVVWHLRGNPKQGRGGVASDMLANPGYTNKGVSSAQRLRDLVAMADEIDKHLPGVGAELKRHAGHPVVLGTT